MQIKKTGEICRLEQRTERESIVVLWYRTLLSEFFCGENVGRALLWDLGVFLFAFLFAGKHVAFGCFPLGFALLFSVKARVLPVLLGCLAAALTMESRGMLYLSLYLLAFLMRTYLSAPFAKRSLFPVNERFYGEPLSLRLGNAAAVVLFLAFWELSVAGLQLSALLYIAAYALILPVGVLAFYGIFCSDVHLTDLFGVGEFRPNMFGHVSPLLGECSALAVFTAAVFSLHGISLFGMELDSSLLILGTLFLARRFGAVRACIAGAVPAWIVDPVMIPAFALLGLVSGLFWQFGAFYALTFSSACAIGWAAFIGGLSGFLSLAPEIGVMSLLALPAVSGLRSDHEAEKKVKEHTRAKEHVELVRKKREVKEEKLPRLVSAFSSVSALFYSMADASHRPTAESYMEACVGATDPCCADCIHHLTCYAPNGAAQSALWELSQRMAQTSSAWKDPTPDRLPHDCPAPDKVLDYAASACGELGKQCPEQGNLEFLSSEYAMIGKLLEAVQRSEHKEERENEALHAAVEQYFAEQKLPIHEISAVGERNKRLTFCTPAVGEVKRKAKHIHSALEEICGCRLTPPEFHKREGVLTVRLQAKRKYSVEYATAGLPSDTGESSGDRVRTFGNAEERFYGVISDGMGSGETAGRMADLTVGFLEQMFRAGSPKSPTLRLLNNVLRRENGECSATVDLLELDLLYGRAVFLKSGSPPSYIRRGENVFQISAKTPPMGILRRTQAEKIDFDLQAGDVIVLLSDGVSYPEEESGKFLSLLSGMETRPLSEVAKELLALSGVRSGRHDDMTVLLVRIGDADISEQNSETRSA